jgi:nitroreductase
VGKERIMADPARIVGDALYERFGERFAVDDDLPGLAELASLAGRRVRRRYSNRGVSTDLVRLLCACALSAPSKSDLQQGDILIVRDVGKRKAIADLLPAMPWVGEAPVFLVFLANGRRVPQVAALRGKPFANDHLDLFFNAVSDASIVLATFLRAAETVGLGCCPISVIRDHARAVSELLKLPAKVIPLAGLCVGWPVGEGMLTPRLPLATTLHEDSFSDRTLAQEIDAYDRRRAATRPYRSQRDVARFGEAKFYGWSEDKARQYAEPNRAEFGAFVRTQGFNLD